MSNATQNPTENTTALAGLTAGTWNVDAGHSSIGFVARHLMVAKVRGRFTSFTGTVTVSEDPLQSKVEASVDTASVSTGDAGRDGHLVSADFFDVEQFPTMTLVSTGLRPNGTAYLLDADLTIKGTTKPVTFELDFDGVASDPWGGTRAGFTAETEINRREFGLDFHLALETGGVVVGDKIKIQLDIEAVRA